MFVRGARSVRLPNHRSENKVRFGGFITKELHAELVRLAIREDRRDNAFGFAMRLAIDELYRRDKSLDPAELHKLL